jgi:hypothetical protein
LRRNRTNAAIGGAQQETLPRTIVPFADTGHLLTAERMEGVDDADKLRRRDGNACISR